MLKKGFIEEASQQARIQAQTLNIIFLDIDGVINPSEPRQILGVDDLRKHPSISDEIFESLEDKVKIDLCTALGFSDGALSNLRQLCEAHKAGIVISSAWREGLSLEQLKTIFSLSNLSEYILDVTPQFRGAPRAQEIEAWLLDHRQKVKSFVILDDVDSKISMYFGERFIHCKTLFECDALYKKTSAVLSQPVQYEITEAVKCWNAIKQNSRQLTSVIINCETLTTLKLHFGYNAQALFDHLFHALAQNTEIKRLTFHFIYLQQKPKEFLERISTLIQTGQMNLDYLDIAHNHLQDISPLLSAFDKGKVCIPHICFNANPLNLENQKALAAWIEHCTHPMTLDLDLSESGWGLYRLHKDVIDALVKNPHVTINTREDVLPSSVDEEVRELQLAGRLKVDEVKKCCIM